MFQFKQFSVEQNLCAMKIGTDSILLGAWAPIQNNPLTILDIGTGTGVIALMLAQRTVSNQSNIQSQESVQIDAFDIDENAYEQASENFENSPWNDNLYCFHAGLDEFIEEPDIKYDLIVSNPPFFSENYKSDNYQRNLARFQDAMPFEQLLEAADLLLSENGTFSIIIPYYEEKKFIDLAGDFELYPFKITRVKGNINSAIKRSLLAFSRNPPPSLDANELTIEISRNIYTPEYINLTKDFYLKM